MQYAPPFHITLKGRGDIVRLANLADLHIGSAAVDYDLLTRDVAYIAATPNCYAIATGDLAQFIGHLDKRFTPDNLSPEALRNLGNIFIWQCQQVAEILRPIKHKIIASTPGNHEGKAGGGSIDVHRQIWAELGGDMRYCLTWLGSVRLIISRAGHSSYNCDVLCHHGRGAARTKGAKKNILVTFMNDFPNWNVYFMGHVHEKDYHPTEEIAPNTPHTDSRMIKRIGVVAGTYEKCYEDGVSTYGERQAYHPASMGFTGVTMRLACNRNGTKERLEISHWEPNSDPEIDNYWPTRKGKRRAS